MHSSYKVLFCVKLTLPHVGINYEPWFLQDWLWGRCPLMPHYKYFYFILISVYFCLLGTFPGAAEQDAGNKMESASEPDGHTFQHRRHVRGLHLQPPQTAGQPGQRQDEAGGRPAQHAGTGRGLQKQVSLGFYFVFGRRVAPRFSQRSLL